MTNQNGQLILQALDDIGEPVTMAKISAHIADTAKVPEDVVKNAVKKTVQAGVRYGFIQQKNRKYFAAPLDTDSISETGSISETDSISEEDGLKESDVPSKSNEKGTGEMESRRMRRRGAGRRRGGSRRRRSNSSRRRSSSSRRRSSRRKRH